MLWFDERGITYPSNPWFGENLDFSLALQAYDEQNDVDTYYEFIQAMIDLKVEEPEVREDQIIELWEVLKVSFDNYQNFCANSNSVICTSPIISNFAADYWITKSLKPMHLLLPQLGIEELNQKIDLLTRNYPDFSLDPPNCENCSVAEYHVVSSDELRALEMLECAIIKLSNFDSNKPSNELNIALANHFGGSQSELVARFIRFVLNHIRHYPYTRHYEAQDLGEGLCENGVTAWSYPVVHATSVKLCRPAYWNKSDVDRSGTLIHEWCHLYFVAGDFAYDWQSEYDDLNTIEALLNADSYSEFVKDICDE